MTVPDRPEGALIDLARARPCVPLDDLVGGTGGVLVIAPHPDDETLGCGLAIRAALASRRDVGVLLLTGGGNSHPASRTHPPDAMKALRRSEFARALAALGRGVPGRLASRMLDLPDGAVPHDAAALDGAVLAALELADGIDAGALWTTWGGDPHIDHLAASRLGDLVARARPLHRRDYAVWGRFGDAARGVASARVMPFRDDPHGAAKRDAIAAYASQLTPLIADDPDGFVMPLALVAHFADAPEIFLVPEMSHAPDAASAVGHAPTRVRTPVHA